MDQTLFVQIFIGVCFLGLMVILFIETQDYLTYAILIILIVGLIIGIVPETAERLNAEDLILSVDWDVIIFLFCLFLIIEILNDKKIFHQIALQIIDRFQNRPRLMFYGICLTSTFIATLIEDLSVAIVFIPIIIHSCKGLKISPIPYLYGVTICINLASTLTPFGSAENIIIANHFGLSLHWHLINLGLYFIITLFITLFLIDQFILKRFMKKERESIPGYLISGLIDNTTEEKKPIIEEVLTTSRLKELKNHYFASIEDDHIPEPEVTKKSEKIVNRFKKFDSVFYKNLVGLIVLVGILLVIRNIVVAGMVGMLLFVLLNPIKTEKGKKIPSVTYYLRKIDAKLIYFFVILFILVYFLQISEITLLIDQFVEKWGHHDVFLIAVGVMVLVSVLSGFLDDAPVTILFLPVIADLIFVFLHPANPIFIAFTLGINLGGNFLPQGAACDMMTLELARKNKVSGFTYKSLTLVGGLFALLHIFLGIGYVWLYLRVFPG